MRLLNQNWHKQKIIYNMEQKNWYFVICSSSNKVSYSWKMAIQKSNFEQATLSLNAKLGCWAIYLQHL